MKIGITLPLMVLASFVCMPAHAAPNERDAKEARAASDKIESQTIVDELQRKYGRPSWYESASDAELLRAPEDARVLLSRLSALSLDSGEGPIANEQSVVNGIRQTVREEQNCRADRECMAYRAEKKSEDQFLETVLFPLCQADDVLESADGDATLSGEEIRDAQNKVRTLMGDYARVMHHPFKGWRSDCE